VAGQPAPGFAGLLQQLRAEAGLTQEELGQAARVSPRTISDLERGIHRSAHQDTARLLADALGLEQPVRGLFVAAARGRVPAAEVLAARSGLPRAISNPASGQAGVARMRRAVIDSPYRGLKAFEEQDAAFFFGREAATTALLERMSWQLEGKNLLLVSGVSGVGKSSLLRAGVLPQIRKAGLAGAPEAATWPCLVLTPTRAPLDELALRVGLLAGSDAAGVRRGLDADPAGFALTARQVALAGRRAPAEEPENPKADRDQPWGQQRMVLVVDQLEELFALRVDEGQRRAFIMALHAAASAGHGPDQAPASLVVLGVRADYEARCADFPQLADAVQDRYLVTSMTERQLWLAITEPARKAGAWVDADLVGALLGEAGTSQSGVPGAGALAWLSHALDQAWRHRTGEAVTLADYERTGGIGRATADSAQGVYERLTPAQQGAARQVFTRLAAASSDERDVVGHATWAELTEGKSAAEARDIAEVVAAFAAERILSCSADAVEISHAALLTAWPLLRDTWLADTHADRIVRTRLHHAAAEWARHSQDPSYLYTGSLLQAAADTAARIHANPVRYLPLSRTERDFLHASDGAQRHRNHRRWAFLSIVTVLIVGLAATMVFAVRASILVAQEHNAVTSIQLSNKSQRLSGSNPALSKLLSIVAWRLAPTMAAQKAARDAMLAAAENPGLAVLTGHAHGADAAALAPDGKAVAIGTTRGSVLLWRDVAARWQQVAALPTEDGPVTAVTFSPDSKAVAIGTAHGSVLLWRAAAARWQRVAALPAADGPVTAVALSPNGNAVAIGTAHGGLLLWRDVAAQWQQVAALPTEDGPVTAVTFSPDGNAVAIGTAHGSVLLRRAAAAPWQHVAALPTEDGPVTAMTFNRDGNAVAIGTAHGSVLLWRAADPRRLLGRPLARHVDPVDSVVFSQDGVALPSRNFDQAIRPLNVVTPHQGLPKMADLVPYLCALAGQTLTRAEWEQQVTGSPYVTICF